MKSNKFLLTGILLILLSLTVNAEILNETTEKQGDAKSGTFTIYSGKVFENYQGTWQDFSTFTEWNQTNDSFVLSFENGVKSIEFKPYVYYDGQKVYWESLSNSLKNKMNIQSVLNEERFSAAWGWFVTKPSIALSSSIDTAGIELIPTNTTVALQDYNELVWNSDLNVFEVRERKMFLIDEKIALKFPHQYDNEYEMVFSSNSIDFTLKEGTNDLDPIANFNPTDDHYREYTECLGASSKITGTSTGIIGAHKGVSPIVCYNAKIYFDTSSLSESTLNSATLKVYNNAVSTTPRWTPPSSFANVLYQVYWNASEYKGSNGTLDWSTTGWKNKNISVSKINTDGNTWFWLDSTWNNDVPDTKYATVHPRFTEYGSTIPVLDVNYGLNDAPTMASIDLNKTFAREGQSIKVTALDVNDSQQQLLDFFCATTSPASQTNNDFCSQTGIPYPYSNVLCIGQGASGNTLKTIFCRLFDSYAYSTEQTDTYTADNIAPNTVADYNNFWQYGNAEVALNCDDGNSSGCNETKYRVDSDPSNNENYRGWQTYSTPILFSSDGNYGLQFYSIDNAGNQENTKTVFILIDRPTEQEARNAIEQGINNALTTPSIYTDQQIYTRNSGNQQQKGAFDKVAREGVQTWAFNYKTGAESFTGMNSLTDIVNIWENEKMAYSEIVNSVEAFINSTKR